MIVTRISGVLGAVLVGAALFGAPASAAPKANAHAAAVDYVVAVAPSEAFHKKLLADIGERELDSLAADLRKAVNLELARGAFSDRRVALIIHDAVPNRPTFEQLGHTIGLDFARSFGFGGADVEARILTANGEFVRSYRLAWRQSDEGLPLAGLDVWYDADRAFFLFASGLRKSLAKEAAGRES